MLILNTTLIHANEIDSSKPLVCAIVEVIDCGVKGDCEPVDPEFVNLPNIFKVDTESKVLHSGERKTKIDHVTKNKQVTSDDNKAWSFVLSNNTGKFTGAIAAYDYGFLLFGSCIVD